MTTPESDSQEAIDAALAILTLVTGDEWDRNKLVAQSSELRSVAVHTLKKQGLTDADAETFVESRWANYAADLPTQATEPSAPLQSSEPSPSTQGTGDLSAMANTEANSTEIPDMRSRLADYRARRAAETQTDPAP